MPPQSDDHIRECVLYLRKSKGKAGIARQRKESAAYAERIRWRIVAEFVEPNTTAFAKIDEDGALRPEFDKMVAFLHRDTRMPALGVLAWHADRLSRNSGEVRPFSAVCAKGGHPVETVRSGSYDLSTPNGRKRFRDDVSDAEHEVDHLIERIDSQKAEAAAAGAFLGGRRPFGFKKDGIRHRKAEAQAIAAAVRDVLSGASLARVAREWNAAGLMTSGGKRWRAVEVRRVLLRPRNAGLMVWRGEIVGRAAWEPIVPERRWRAMVRVLEDASRRTSPGPDLRWLGSGIYVCGVCGQARMRVHRFTGRDRAGYPVYRCRGGGQHVSRAAEPLDVYVAKHVVARLSRPDSRALLVDEGRADRAELEARLLELRAELVDAEAQVPRTVHEARAFASLAETLAGQIEQVEGKLIRPDRAAILRDLIEAPDVGEAWKATPVDRRRAVLRALFTVTVRPAPRGRPAGWRPGEGYFDPAHVDVVPL